MTLLNAWRQEASALIPRGFLRRDQKGDSLWLSDYPRREGADAVTQALRQWGFTVALPGDGLAHIDGSEEKYRSLLSALPRLSPALTDRNLYPWALAKRLIRADVPLDRQDLFPTRYLIRLLNAGMPDAFGAFAACAARCQRQRRPAPTAAGYVILTVLAEQEGGMPPC